MSDQIQAARDDLAFMRSLVQTGDAEQRATGGAIMASGGFIFAACSLLVWAASIGSLPVPASFYGWAWLVAMAVFLAVLFACLRGKRDGGGVKARASGVLWSAVGAAIGVIVLCCGAVQYATGSPVAWALLPSVVFTLYGAGWTVAATLSGRAWERWVAIGGFAAAVAIAFLSQSAWLYLAYAAGLALLAGAPGLVMMRARAAA